MILVTLGTQDKPFPRLLDAIQKQVNHGLNEKVVVQAGCTKYESENMEIHQMLDKKDFETYLEQADLVITHGGAGTILSAMKMGKKIIAIPRLKKYKEHSNDHQKEIVEQFVKEGYILTCSNLDELGKVIDRSKEVLFKQYKGNHHKIITLLEQYIEETNENKRWIPFLSLSFSMLLFLINIILFYLMLPLGAISSSIVSGVITYGGMYFVNYVYIYREKLNFRNMLLCITFGIIEIIIDTYFMIYNGTLFRYRLIILFILLSSQFILSKKIVFRRKK